MKKNENNLIRKYKLGVASVLIGTLYLGTNTTEVSADTVSPTTSATSTGSTPIAATTPIVIPNDGTIENTTSTDPIEGTVTVAEAIQGGSVSDLPQDIQSQAKSFYEYHTSDITKNAPATTGDENKNISFSSTIVLPALTDAGLTTALTQYDHVYGILKDQNGDFFATDFKTNGKTLSTLEESDFDINVPNDGSLLNNNTALVFISEIRTPKVFYPGYNDGDTLPRSLVDVTPYDDSGVDSERQVKLLVL